MALLKRGRSKRLILDIGTSAIRLCELSQTKAGYQLTKYYQRELGIDPSMPEEEKVERRQQVLDALLKEAKIRAKKTITAVPGQSVFTRNRPLPPVPEYKVTQIVRYEIQQQIPFSLDQIALDYQVLHRTEAGGYDVMMAAIKVDVVEKGLHIVEKAKRSIDVVDVAPLAAYNWLKHTGEFGEEGECVALIDLGATTTDIVIQKDNQFRFTRSLNVGGNDITEAISSNFNMSFEDAEKLKRERGFAPTGNPQRDGKGGEIIGNVLDRLVGEINRSFAYFRSQPGGGPTTRVIVTGGGACLRNIIPYLQRELGIAVRIAQPLAGLAVAAGASEASEHPEQSCVVLGLALRTCENVPIQINLIPPRIIEIARRKEQAFYWVFSFATLFLIIASIVPVTEAKVKLIDQDIDRLKTGLAMYDPAIVDSVGISDFETRFMYLKSDVGGYIGDVTKLDTIVIRRQFWLDYLLEINSRRPEAGGITISSIETAVFGGLGNTGDAARQKLVKKDDPTAQEKTDDLFAAAKPSGGGDQLAAGGIGSGSSLADYFGGLGPAGGRSTGTVYNVEGFSGINPNVPARMSSMAGGGPRRGPAREPSIVEPNGFIIWGYAADREVLQDYRDRLKKSKMFIKDGVHMHVAKADEVSGSELDDAQVGGRDIGHATGGGSSSGGSDGGGGISINLNAGLLAGAGSSSSSSGRSAGPKVTAFRIDVQFLGDPIPGPGGDR